MLAGFLFYLKKATKKVKKIYEKGLPSPHYSAIIIFVPMNTYTPGWCNGSTSDSGSFGLGSSPSPGAKWRYGQAAKTSPSQGEIKGSIPFSATKKFTLRFV